MGSTSRDPSPVEHVEVTIRYRDGTTTRFAAQEPQRLDVAITWPDRLSFMGDPAVAATMVLPPVDPVEFSMDFHVHPRHGMAIERPEGEP